MTQILPRLSAHLRQALRDGTSWNHSQAVSVNKKPALLITSCGDSLMWYRDLIGQVVDYRTQYRERDYLGERTIYISTEPAGYSNIVSSHDAKVVYLELVGGEWVLK